MTLVYSYRDNLSGMIHNFTPNKGKIVITFKHPGVPAPKDIPEFNAFLNSVAALKTIGQSSIMKIPRYISDSFKGAPPNDPSITPERVPVVGSKSKVGFGLITCKDEDQEAAKNALDSNADVTDYLEAMTDEIGNTRYFVPGYFVLQLNANYQNPADNDSHIIQLGYEILSRERTMGFYILKVPDGQELFSAIGEANGKVGVKFAETLEFGFDEALSFGSGIEFKTFNPADPAQAWGLSRINASGAWNIDPNNPVRGTADVVVVTIDSGAKLTHQDLDGNLLNRNGADWDFTSTSSSVPNDTHGQGTAVVGVAAAESNSTGSLGMSNLGKFMPLKINLNGASPYTDRYNAIMYVGADVTGQAVVNASTTRYVMNIGWKMGSDVSSIHSAITEAYSNNVIIVCGAGNTKQSLNTNPMYPAVYTEVIPVGATEDTDGRWNDTSKSAGTDMSGSNYGTRSSDNKMVIGAPGKLIRTTKYSSLSDTVYEDRTGTAIAAAFVTGLAALVWQLNKRRCNGFTWNNVIVRNIIMDPNNCVNISAIGDNNGKINYLIDAQQVLENANTRSCQP